VRSLLARYAERLDAASLRERVLVFGAAALLVVFLFDAALLGPERAKQRRIQAQFDEHQKQLAVLKSTLQDLALKGDPDAASRSRHAALRAEAQALNARIVHEQRRFTPPERMRAVLEEMLKAHQQLSLLDLKTLPATALSKEAAGSSSAGLYRHGIELVVSGRYLDLYEYLRALENLPSQLYWGRAELLVSDYPTATLKLVVYTVSFDSAWLIV